MLRSLIVTHGDLGRAMRATAETMTGLGGDVEVLSNENHSRDSLCDAVESCLDAWGGAEGIVLTDIPGGSCTHAALVTAAHHPNVAVVTGVNLPMLVDFIFNRGKFTAREMAERLESKGQTSVRNLEKELHPSARASGAENSETS